MKKISKKTKLFISLGIILVFACILAFGLCAYRKDTYTYENVKALYLDKREMRSTTRNTDYLKLVDSGAYYGVSYRLNSYSAYIVNPIDIEEAIQSFEEDNEHLDFMIYIKVVVSSSSITNTNLNTQLQSYVNSINENGERALVRARVETYNYNDYYLQMTNLLKLPSFTPLNYNYVFIVFGSISSYQTTAFDITDSADLIGSYSSLTQLTTDDYNKYQNNTLTQNEIDYYYNLGKTDGVNEYMQNVPSVESQNVLVTLFDTIFTSPINLIKEAFNIDFLGINIASVLLGFISVLILAYVIKKLL